MILVIGGRSLLWGNGADLLEQLCRASVNLRNTFAQDGIATYEKISEDISESILFNLRRKDLRE